MQLARWIHRFAFVLGSTSLLGCSAPEHSCPQPKTAPVAARAEFFVGNVREAITKNQIGSEEKTKLFGLFENADHTVNVIQTRGAVPAHHHVEHDEMVMILEGKGTFTIEGQTREVSPGDILVIPRGAVHSYVHQGDGVTQVISVFSPKFDPKDRIMAEKKP